MAHLSQLHAFTQAEQSRLSTYRAAVAAGFYPETVSEQSRGYRLTPVELARPVVYKVAVTAGFYSDQTEDGDRED
jgi:hypothetical protein